MCAEQLVIWAPAKVNLTLEVLGRRPDGYHDICSVMQAIGLADRLTVAPGKELQLQCEHAELEGTHNLVWQAAALLRRQTGESRGAMIFLEKRIPVAAGLGGGSSDAAATLLALDRLWGLALGRPRLMELAAQIGSDVPFFLGEGTCALAEGRGERLTQLPALPARWVVLLKPPLSVSAGAVYAVFPQERWASGRRTRAWLEQARRQREVPEPFNDLEAAALHVAPQAAAAREALLEAGAAKALMSGSGPTYFALFEEETAARGVYDRLKSRQLEAYLTAFAGGAASIEPSYNL